MGNTIRVAKRSVHLFFACEMALSTVVFGGIALILVFAASPVALFMAPYAWGCSRASIWNWQRWRALGWHYW